LYDLGIVNIWGGGIIHNFNYWFDDPLPIDIGFGYYFQNFKVGDVFTNTASQYGIFLSKKLTPMIEENELDQILTVLEKVKIMGKGHD